MQRTTAIAVMLSLLLSLWGDGLHACDTIQKSVTTDATAPMEHPCHGEVAPSVMECCDEDGEHGLCLDCACAAIATPASLPEDDIPQSGPPAAGFPRLPGVDAPPDGPPGSLLRPPIVRR